MSISTFERDSKWAMDIFEEWVKNPYPVYDSENELFVPSEDEKFYPAFDYIHKNGDGYLEPRIDYRYYVSNKGHVLSINKRNSPLLMKVVYGASQSREYGSVSIGSSKGNKGCNGDSVRIHKLVWFSYMAYVLENGGDLPYYYGVVIDSLDDLIALSKQTGEYEVHHINENKQDNNLENLEFLPVWLHNVYKTLRKKKGLDAVNALREVLSPDTAMLIIDDNGSEGTEPLKYITETDGLSVDQNFLDEWKTMSMTGIAVNAVYNTMLNNKWLEYREGQVRYIAIIDLEYTAWFFAVFVGEDNKLKVERQMPDEIGSRMMDMVISCRRADDEYTN